MKKWKIISKTKALSDEKIIEILLKNRNIDAKNPDTFFHPDISTISRKSAGLDEKEFEKFKIRVKQAIDNGEQIVVFGDYDVDGICASAILWETLFSKTKKVIPYIPNRVDEGYGLSKKGIDNVLIKYPDTKLIITVDNGIIAYDAVTYANKLDIDVVITDHHQKGNRLPEAFCILHTTNLCGAGIAFVIAKELEFETKDKINEKLSLATLATIADLVVLVGDNRTIVKEGLKILQKTKRIGLIELFVEAKIDKSQINVYVIGHVIAPRLNATGRIQSAMNALRLLCTNNKAKAIELSEMLGSVNRNRKELTDESVKHAKLLAIERVDSKKIIVVADGSYNQGIVGLVASQLVETYYKPSFAIAKGDKISKGSARSITGVNIIELLRSVSDTLIEVGGHPMAAGFSVATNRIEEFAHALSKKAEEVVKDELLKRVLAIDMLLSFEQISNNLIEQISKMSPFGMGNPEPVFATENVEVIEVRKIGLTKDHLKMKVVENGIVFDAIAFGFADKVDVKSGNIINIAYTIDTNEWNGKASLQLKIRDIYLL